MIPVPTEEILGIIKKASGEDKKLEVAENLLHQWLKHQPYFPNDYGKLPIYYFITKKIIDEIYFIQRRVSLLLESRSTTSIKIFHLNIFLVE